jgi:hypothetical protein
MSDNLSNNRAIHKMIARLLDEAPVLNDDPTQAKALQCHVILRGQIQPLPGALSTTPEGGLRLLTPGAIDNRPCLMEQFFDYDDVVAVIIERAVTAAPRQSSIIMGS